MSNIYSAKFMNEATTSLRDKVFHTPVNETYLYSAMGALREMNNTIDNATKKLYVQIAEAESKEEENKLFADYFYQFKSIFQDFSNRVQQMKSRMIINIENKVETWEDLFKNDEYIASFDKEFTYSGYNFSHMEDANYPRLSLHKFYQKEFDYIGQLMQDSSTNASPSVRLKIIATVCNNFSNCSGDKNWIKDLIKDMVDIDDKEITRSYSECIYNSLRDKYEINVNKGMLYTCKENLCDYEDIIDAACKLCDNLLYDLDKVAENISSYLFRNQDNKLKIKTDTDGIIDRDYRLDTYSMNQLDLFLKNKTNQIKKLLNVYSVAVGIKFDTVVDYIQQNIEILKMAKEYELTETEEPEEDVNDNTEVPDDDNADDSDLDLDDYNGDGSIDDEDIEHQEDDDDIDSVANPDDSDSSDKEPIEEEPEDEIPEIDTSEESAPEFDVNGEDFEEGYLFESELFELEMMCDMYSMHESVRSALLLEEETPNNNNNTTSNSNPTVQNLADKANVWQKIVSKLIALWNKFKEVISTLAKPKVDYLKKNEKFINTSLKGVEGTVTLKYNPQLVELENLKIVDLNYTSMEEHLSSEEAYCTQYYATYYNNKGEKSFSDFIKEKILKEGEYKINPNDLGNVKKAYDFCEDYIEKTDSIRKQAELIEKAQRIAKSIKESHVDTDHSMYFSEMEVDVTKTDNGSEGGESKPASGMAGKLAVYFKVSSQVLAAKMTIYQKIFNEYFNFCHWHIKTAGGPGFVAAGKVNTNDGKSNTNQS